MSVSSAISSSGPWPTPGDRFAFIFQFNGHLRTAYAWFPADPWLVVVFFFSRLNSIHSCAARAGEGSRTLVNSLEGYGSTVELHPQSVLSGVADWPAQWGVKDLNLRRHCHQIYSLTPLTTRETPPFVSMTS